MRLFAAKKQIAAWILSFWLIPYGWCQAGSQPQSDAEAWVVEEVASGLGVPWGMVFIGPHQLLVTERRGRISLINTQTGAQRRITGAPAVLAVGQGGLLDVAVPPDFSPGDWIYFTYSKNIAGRGATTLGRGKLTGNLLQQWHDLLVTRSTSDTGRHYGSRIAFDNRNRVYFGVGDRGDRANGQDLTSHAGSVLRLYRDGRIPLDNPFVGRSDALPEIWSYGHRNPQGLVFDQQHRQLWEIEHGPRGGDEINRIVAGGNYGWPVISYGKEYWGPVSVGEGTHKPGMEQPVKVYTPSIAPGSLLFYSGSAFPEWRGNLFAGALKLTHLNRIVLDAEGRVILEQRLLESLAERIRALCQSPEGWIYLSTDSGKILRLRPR